MKSKHLFLITLYLFLFNLFSIEVSAEKNDFYWLPDDLTLVGEMIGSDGDYTNGYDYESDYILVRNNLGKYGLIGSDGKYFLQCEYDFIGCFSEGMAMVGKYDINGNIKIGYIDSNGELVIPMEYDINNDSFYDFRINNAGIVYSFSDGLALVTKKDSSGKYKYGYINKTGEIVIPIEREEPPWVPYRQMTFSEGRAAITKKDNNGNEHIGFIDKNNNVVIPLEYEYTNSGFKDGLAVVKKNDKYGVIDINGETIIPFEYDFIYSECGSLFIAERGKLGLIDRNGNPVTAFIYDYCTYAGNDIYRVCIGEDDQNSKYGLIDENGREILPVEYDDISESVNGFIIVNKNDKYGVIDCKGNFILTLDYDYGELSSNDGQIEVEICGEESDEYCILDTKGVFPALIDYKGLNDLCDIQLIEETDSHGKCMIYKLSNEQYYQINENYLLRNYGKFICINKGLSYGILKNNYYNLQNLPESYKVYNKKNGNADETVFPDSENVYADNSVNAEYESVTPSKMIVLIAKILLSIVIVLFIMLITLRIIINNKRKRRRKK